MSNHSSASSSVSANAVKIGWVLRDMMQSTGVWTFDANHLARLVGQAVKVGFSSLEIGGGQSYQIALENGANPYQILRNAKAAVDNTGACLPLQVLLRGANQLGLLALDGVACRQAQRSLGSCCNCSLWNCRYVCRSFCPSIFKNNDDDDVDHSVVWSCTAGVQRG